MEEDALAEAEQQCLADADARGRRRDRDAVRREGEDVEFQARFAAEIARLYPGCPAERAQAIASHATGHDLITRSLPAPGKTTKCSCRTNPPLALHSCGP